MRISPIPATNSRMAVYQRRLPHHDVIGQPVFVSFRLWGSLPANRVFPPSRITNSGRAFAAIDRLLDTATTGPMTLRRPEVANLVVSALQHGRALRRYELHAWVVMPNHVHILATPGVTGARWLGPLKGFTAHEGNRLAGTTGRPFWQDESYDHLVRDGEFDRIQRYIEWNPVRAGLAAAPQDYPWSSASKGPGGAA